MVTLTTDALPDDLVAYATSIDANRRYNLATRFAGGVGGHLTGGEWDVDANHNQIATVTNIGSKPTNALLTLHYENGQKSYELQQTIAPGDQMWVNLARLVRDRVADRNGNTLPVDLKSVTYELRDLAPGLGSLSVGSLALDDTFGFSITPPPCPSCCPLIAIQFDSGFLDLPPGVTDPVGIIGQNQCTGAQVNVTADFGTWSSNNDGIAKASYAKVQGIAPGSAVVSADGFVNGPGECECSPVMQNPTLQVNVQPQITGITPPRGLIGNSVSVTIKGNGFSPSPSVFAGSDIPVTVDSYSSTQISATFAIAPSANGGNHNVVVTVAGQPSPAANFYVQIPKTLIRDTGYGTGGLGSLVSITNGNVLDIYGNTLLTGECGVYRNIGYFLIDQESPAQTIQGDYTLVENFTNYTTDVQGLTPPPTEDNPIVYAQTMLGDTQFFGTKATSGCPGSNDHESFDQNLTVEIDSSHSYGLSMENSISRGYYSGTPTVNVTIINP